MKNNTKETIIFIILIAIIGFVIYEFSFFDNKQKELDEDNKKMIIDKVVVYQSENEIKENTSVENKVYESKINDHNSLLISSDVEVKLDNIKINKSGDTLNSNNSINYGINSGLLAIGINNLTINNSTIDTNAIGANGVFGDKSTITLDNITINNKKDYSSGIVACNDSSITFNNGYITTNGLMSPTLYSRSNIEVNNSKLVSNNSEGVIIEGKNSIIINDSNLISNNNILLYQPFNNESTNGEAILVINNTDVTTNKGDTFFVTNINADIKLINNKFVNNDEKGLFMRIQKDNWGIDGINGGVVNLKLDNQKIMGDIYVDKISVLNISLINQSYYEGIINGNNTGAIIELVLDKKSKIKLMGDSYIASINDANRAYTNIDFNGYKLYINGNSIN